MKLPALSPASPLQALAVWKNPVLVKEIRTRMRGSRAFLLLTAHLLILGVALLMVYLLISSDIGRTMNPTQRGSYGKLVFGLIVWLELVMVSFTAPALTSGAIALERERQTFDLLKVTLLKARTLVLGKYFAGLVFIFLLLVTSLPLFSPAFILGGVVLEEIVIAVLILSASAIAYCAVGLFFSSLFSRTLVATVLAYAFTIFVNFGVPMIGAVLLVVFSTLNADPTELPNTALVLLYYLAWLVISVTPLATIIATETALLSGEGLWLVQLPLRGDQELTMLLPWITYVAIYLLLSWLLIWISARLAARSER